MPTYVYSGAAGANNGTSWADAYTSIASTTGVAAGTEIWVASDHSELPTANTTHNWSNGTLANPVRILSVNRADDTLTAGAIIGTDPNNFYNYASEGNIWCWGVDFRVSFVFTQGSVASKRQVYDTCTLRNTRDNISSALNVGGNSLSPTFSTYRNCTFVQTAQAAWRPIALGYGLELELLNCTFSPPASAALLMSAAQLVGSVVLRDSDVSAFDAIASVGRHVYLHVSRCKVKSTVAILSGSIPTPVGRLVMESCDDGTISVPPVGPQFWQTYWGVTKASLARYRTSGANDGENANEHSWEMTTNANARELFNPLESPPIVRWVDAGSQTLTIYVASGVTLQDDEFWIDVSSPDEGGSPTAQGTFNTSRADPRDTPANLTTDGSSTWNGTGVGTKQKIDVSINPAVAGPVTVRCFLAKASTTVYVDPKIGVA